MKNELKFKAHTDRSDLVGEHIWGDAGQVVLLVVFLIVWIADSFILKYSTFLAESVPLYIRLAITFAVLSCTLYFSRAGLRIVFGEVREQSMVIRTGVFNIVRHPIYLGSLLFYLGLIIATASLASLVLWFVIIAFYQFISKHEEKLLLNRFGVDYEKYRSDVPMWIPKLKISN